MTERRSSRSPEDVAALSAVAPSGGYERHHESTAAVPASAFDVFSFIDDHRRLASHMSKSSWMTGGGRMDVTVDDRHGQAIGSHIRLSGRAFGFRVFLDEVVTSHQPPHRKTWETVGTPRLLVVGRYAMGVEIRDGGPTCSLRVWIDYDLPPRRWLGRLFGSTYAKWCVSRMISDTRDHFSGEVQRGR